MYPIKIKLKVRRIRSLGKTYSEIKSILKVKIPKSTLSGWCEDIKLPETYYDKVRKINRINFAKARAIAGQLIEAKRQKFFNDIDRKNSSLLKLYRNNIKVKKIVLVILYLAEGSKTSRSSLMFGNSDPLIIKMFVNLLRECYKIDESKFRCTVQCRADQNVSYLEGFWSKVTEIPLGKFYKARIDKRTIGQKSRKLDYKGVCRIDYFSSAVDFELKRIAQNLCKI